MLAYCFFHLQNIGPISTKLFRWFADESYYFWRGGGEQTYSSGEYLTTDSGGEGLSVTNNMMTYEQTQASDFTKMILGQPLGHYHYFETTNMEPISSADRYGVIGGDQKVTVEETADPSLDNIDAL